MSCTKIFLSKVKAFFQHPGPSNSEGCALSHCRLQQVPLITSSTSLSCKEIVQNVSKQIQFLSEQPVQMWPDSPTDFIEWVGEPDLYKCARCARQVPQPLLLAVKSVGEPDYRCANFFDATASQAPTPVSQSVSLQLTNTNTMMILNPGCYLFSERHDQELSHL